MISEYEMQVALLAQSKGARGGAGEGAEAGALSLIHPDTFQPMTKSDFEPPCTAARRPDYSPAGKRKDAVSTKTNSNSSPGAMSTTVGAGHTHAHARAHRQTDRHTHIHTYSDTHIAVGAEGCPWSVCWLVLAASVGSRKYDARSR